MFLVLAVTLISFAACDVVEEPYLVGADEVKIIEFKVDSVVGLIDQNQHTVTLYFPTGTDVTQLVPTIEVSAGAQVSPASGEAQDFTNPVIYTVIATTGSTTEYKVTAIVQTLVLVPTGKTVLLHDYTGAHCSNCPAAAEIAEGLQEQYDHLVVLSVHAGSLANPYSNNPDLRTPEGDEWFNNNTFNPAGSVNRVKLLTGYILHDSEWTDAVVEALAEPQTIEIRLANDYNETTRQLTTTIDAMELEDITGDLAVTVCLMEDNIVAKQAVEGSSPNNNYVNHNVFRTTFNGAYGEGMAFGDDHLYNKSFSLTLSDDYNADNCYVVAYVYEANEGMKILQTVKGKIK